MKRLAAVLCLLALAGPAWAQPKVKGEATYKPFEKIILRAEDVSSANAQFLWDIDGEAQIEEVGNRLFVWCPPGRYHVRLTAIDFAAKKVERARFSFKVEGEAPPGPPPKPPDPPGPQPMPTAGLKVLIVYESSEHKGLTAAQEGIISGKQMRDWLNAHCSPDAAYPKGWAIWDKDVDTSGMPQHWKDALAAPRTGIPWLVIMDGAGKVVGGQALPADTAATIAVLSKYVPKSQRKAA